MEILNKKSVIELTGRYNGKTVEEVLNKNRKSIFTLIKKGLCFDDEVLKEAHITKTIRDRHAYYEFERHAKDNKKYEKEKMSKDDVIKIVESLNNDNIKYDDEEDEEETEN